MLVSMKLRLNGHLSNFRVNKANRTHKSSTNNFKRGKFVFEHCLNDAQNVPKISLEVLLYKFRMSHVS